MRNPLLIFLGEKRDSVHLEKQEKSKIDMFCEKIVPYVLFICIIILLVLILIIMVKYGASLTGTEANQYYYHKNI